MTALSDTHHMPEPPPSKPVPILLEIQGLQRGCEAWGRSLGRERDVGQVFETATKLIAISEEMAEAYAGANGGVQAAIAKLNFSATQLQAKAVLFNHSMEQVDAVRLTVAEIQRRTASLPESLAHLAMTIVDSTSGQKVEETVLFLLQGLEEYQARIESLSDRLASGDIKPTTLSQDKLTSALDSIGRGRSASLQVYFHAVAALKGE